MAQDGMINAQQATSTTGFERVSLDKVEGTFAFNQDELSSLSDIARALGKAPKHLCGSQDVAAPAASAPGKASVKSVAVKGAVGHLPDG